MPKKFQPIKNTWKPPKDKSFAPEPLPTFLPEPHWQEDAAFDENHITPSVASSLLDRSGGRLTKPQRKLLYGISLGRRLTVRQMPPLRKILATLARVAK